jgi:hypothetical protein
VNTTPLQQHIVIIVIAIGGLALFCLGARAAMTGRMIGPFPGILFASGGACLMLFSGYCYYAVDFKGKAGKRAFFLKIAWAGATGFLAMVLARLAVR